jgi:hypothetical protein
MIPFLIDEMDTENGRKMLVDYSKSLSRKRKSEDMLMEPNDLRSAILRWNSLILIPRTANRQVLLMNITFKNHQQKRLATEKLCHRCRR